MATPPKRIGLVRRGYSATGGAERYLMRFAHTATAQGLDCHLFTSDAWPRKNDPFVHIHRLPDAGPRAFADALQQADPRQHCDVLLSLERVWDCDFYRAGDGVHRAWLERKARVSNPVSTLFRNASAKHQEILDLEKHLFSPESPIQIIANSEMVKHEIIQHYGKTPSQIHVIYNGYQKAELSDFDREEFRQRLGLTSRDVAILFVGSGWERKGLRYAIQAVNELEAENARLFVAGKGKQVGLPSGPVTYLGPVDDPPPFYESVDIFLLPTLYDPFSNACLEAAAHGLPVITTTSNGFAEAFVHGKHGEVVDQPWRKKELSACLARWMDPERRAESRELIRKNGQALSLTANVDATLQLMTASASQELA
ncbi:MAG: glycosyltransferase family 4 protein [Verrucomicrobiota bacterium]